MKDDELLFAIGRKRGALLPGGKLNAQKAAEIVLTDFRSGSIGRMTLEDARGVRALVGCGTAGRGRAGRRTQAQAGAAPRRLPRPGLSGWGKLSDWPRW
jgi:ribosome biogenesis GTPase A